MKLKKGKIDIVVFMLVAVIAGLLILGIFGEPIKKAFAAVTDPLTKKLGLEEGESEQQVVEQELLENVKQVFNNFKAVIEHCKDSLDLRCVCGKMDFTQLNQYSILLSNKRDTGHTYLNLLGSDGLPVQPQIEINNFNNFPTLPKDIYENVGKRDEYLSDNNDFIFSIEKVIYIKQDLSQEEKFNGKMNSIYFSKPKEGFTIFDKFDNKIPMYICRSFSCCGEVPVSSEFTSNCADICSTDGCIAGVDNGVTSKNCGNSFVFEEDTPPDDYCICGDDSTSEPVIPLDYRTDNNPPSCDDICKKKNKVCVKGVDDSLTNLQYKTCGDQFGFEGIDDYCVCSSGTVNEVPLPFDNPPSCNDICGKEGKACIVAIDNGRTKKCDDNGIEFEGDDDFCVCGEASEKVRYNPPQNEKRTCESICNDNGKTSCTMAIDDGRDIKNCNDANVQFETNQDDDYCFCEGDAVWIAPGQKQQKTSCNSICGNNQLECVIGRDDYSYNEGEQGTHEECKVPFGFESKPDDYCVCTAASEKIVPLPYPGDDPKCSEVCGRKSLSCAKGVQNNADKPAPSCDKDVEFDQEDDFCVCGGSSENAIPLNYRTDNNPPSCDDICKKEAKTCGKGVQNTNNNKPCTDRFTFDRKDDFCVCGNDFEKIYGIP